MLEHLKEKDWYVIGGLVAFVLLMGAIGTTNLYSTRMALIVDYISLVPILAGLVMIYLARSLWGGDIARVLEIMGAGLAIHMILFIPHLDWHVQGEIQGGLQPMFGLAPPFWYVFFHGMSLVAYLFIGYAFYLFYQNSKE